MSKDLLILNNNNDPYWFIVPILNHNNFYLRT